MIWRPTDEELTQEVLQDLFEYDHASGKLIRKRCGLKQLVGKPAGYLMKSGYVQVHLGGRSLYAHRIIWRMMFGNWPVHIDHVNRNRSDNRIENLREADTLTNAWNFGLGTNNTSGVLGVSWDADRQKWLAQIQVKKRHIHIGRFEDKNEAIKAYKAAALKHRGEFAAEAA